MNDNAKMGHVVGYEYRSVRVIYKLKQSSIGKIGEAFLELSEAIRMKWVQGDVKQVYK